MLKILYYSTGRDKELAFGVSFFLEERYQISERVSHIGRECRDLKSTLLEARLKKELSEIANMKAMNDELESSNSLLGFVIDSYRKA